MKVLDVAKAGPGLSREILVPLQFALALIGSQPSA
jgi:hypothetical protein